MSDTIRQSVKMERGQSTADFGSDVRPRSRDEALVRRALYEATAYGGAHVCLDADRQPNTWDSHEVVERIVAAVSERWPAPSTSPGTGGGSDLDDALREAYREGHADGSGSDQEGETRPIKYQPKAVSLRIRSKLSPTPTPMRVAERNSELEAVALRVAPKLKPEEGRWVCNSAAIDELAAAAARHPTRLGSPTDEASEAGARALEEAAEAIEEADISIPARGGGSELVADLRKAFGETGWLLETEDVEEFLAELTTRGLTVQRIADVVSASSPTPTPMRVAEAVKLAVVKAATMACWPTLVHDGKTYVNTEAVQQAARDVEIESILSQLGSTTSAREPYGHLPITGPLTLYEALREAIAIGRQAERTTGPALDEDGYARKLAAAVGSPTDEGATRAAGVRQAAAVLAEWAETGSPSEDDGEPINVDEGRTIARAAARLEVLADALDRSRAKALRSPARGK